MGQHGTLVQVSAKGGIFKYNKSEQRVLVFSWIKTWLPLYHMTEVDNNCMGNMNNLSCGLKLACQRTCGQATRLVFLFELASQVEASQFRSSKPYKQLCFTDIAHQKKLHIKLILISIEINRYWKTYCDKKKTNIAQPEEAGKPNVSFPSLKDQPPPLLDTYVTYSCSHHLSLSLFLFLFSHSVSHTHTHTNTGTGGSAPFKTSYSPI